MGWKRTEGRFCRQDRKSTSVCIDAKSPILYPHPRRLSPAWKPTGSVSIGELTSVSGLFGLKIERDLHFEAEQTLSAYALEAHDWAISTPDA
ncbi:DUF2958 domain-containing protein [Shinella fusca]|uniref:DUF2958 domain-containing protein n=1 Tax=Shinella fusca TaxID=544480 RepID=UPI00160FE810|nr:DUF2958 domain-containing protein [Shinella fusca]